MIFAFAACTKDKAYIETKISISAKFVIEDPEFWPNGQDVIFGIFKPGNYIAEKYIELTKPEEDILEIVLKDIDPGEYNCKLFLSVNDQIIAVLAEYGTEEFSENTVLSEKSFSFISLNRVQQQVFNSCITCHGSSSGQAAAELILLEGMSYGNLVNTEAKNSEMLRVKPFSPDESYLVNVLNMEDLSFDHSASSSLDNDDIALVISWIEKGATAD